ncbi:hypothetical protein [Achromobacter aegrifaciens]|uniref:hypothetical protein n=1 Tax=Achromobacter aegrifaciens TaxID=1287736 RepID=UPI0028A912CB|nr:hypothetical protein [Achromobacter aegrifaciens]
MKSTSLETMPSSVVQEPTLNSRSKPDVLHHWIIKNMAPIIFLAAFFLTIVMGNLLFATDFGHEQLARIPHYAVIYDFPTIFTPLYWLLLLLPFFIAPPIIILVRRTLESPIHRWCAKIPEIRPLDYTVFTVIALCHVGYSLSQANAFSLYGTGVDPVSSVEIRFQILSGLRFWTMAVLMSILPYLAVYALIRWIRRSGIFWVFATITVVSIVSVYMILLNMKWPFLVFAAALILTIFAYSKTYPYIKVSAGTVVLFATYLIISTHVFRLADPVPPTVVAEVDSSTVGENSPELAPVNETSAQPESDPQPEPAVSTPVAATQANAAPAVGSHSHKTLPPKTNAISRDSAKKTAAPQQEAPIAQEQVAQTRQEIKPDANASIQPEQSETSPTETPVGPVQTSTPEPQSSTKSGTQLLNEAIDLPKTALRRAPEILFSGLTRMAILYPFYYQIFTEEGNVCGGILEQARRGPVCRPSTYIYTRVFGLDGFEGRGTAPTAVHISGYSLGGWPVALFAMVCASVILGLITCLPTGASAMVGALGIMGAVAGYHFSQVPGEGPLFYDHGLVWTLIPMAIYIAWRTLYARPKV